MKATEMDVCLNVHELGVLISALKLLDHKDEYHIAKEYGPCQTIYNRLNEIYQQMDQSSITPTFTQHESSY
jgi:hypothetical protein